jgi:hypothetical protein
MNPFTSNFQTLVTSPINLFKGSDQTPQTISTIGIVPVNTSFNTPSESI